jgi:uncharacterized protein
VNDPALDTPARLVFSRGTSVKVEIADTSSKRIQGLSGRASLPEDRGLLFVFDTTNYHGIWMNKMLIPIDIIWLDDSFTVVSIKRDAVPESYPEVYRPSVPARYVLEVNAGFVAAHNILVGDRATIFEN